MSTQAGIKDAYQGVQELAPGELLPMLEEQLSTVP